MIKTLLSTAVLACLCLSLHAQTGKPQPNPRPAPNPIPPPTAVLAQNFHAKEIQAEVFGYGEMVNWRGKAQFGGGVGITYFLTRGLGAGLRLSGQDFTGVLVDQVEPRIYFRAPLWDRLAPYGFVAGTYRFPNGFHGCPPVEEGDEWGAGAGGGLEFKFTPHFGAKADIGIYAERDRGIARVTAGVNYSF